MKKTVTLTCLLPFQTETGAGAGDAKTTADAIAAAVHDFCERRRAAPDPDNFPLEPLRDADLKYPSIRVGLDAADAAILKEISGQYKSATQGRVVAWIVAASAWGQRVAAENRATEEAALRREKEITLFQSLSDRRGSERARDEDLAKRAEAFADKVATRAGVDFVRVSPASDKPGAVVHFDFDPRIHEDFRAAFPTARWQPVERSWFIPGSTAVERAHRWTGSLSDRAEAAVKEARQAALQQYYACERLSKWIEGRRWSFLSDRWIFPARDTETRREIQLHLPWCKVRTPMVVEIARRLPGAIFYRHGRDTWAWAPSTAQDVEALAEGLVEIHDLWQALSRGGGGLAAWEARKSEPKVLESGEWVDEAITWLSQKKASGGIWETLNLVEQIAPKRIDVSWLVPFLITPAVEAVLQAASEKFREAGATISADRSVRACVERFAPQGYSVTMKIGSIAGLTCLRALVSDIETVAPPVVAAPSAEEEQTYAERKKAWLVDEDRPVYRR